MDTCSRDRLAIREWAIAAFALAISLAVVAGGCRGWSSGPAVDKVLVISVDTLRADYLGVYNPGLDTSPEIDAFARDAVVFEDAITQATSTLASHTSLFYSVHTFVHRAYLSSQPDPRVTSPIEALRQAGFRTAAFVGGGQLRPQFGLDRGFDVYRQVDTRNINQSTRGKDRLAELHRRVVGFLDEHGSEPFFLFVHNYEPHWPYDPPERFLEMIRESAGRLRGSDSGMGEEGPPGEGGADVGAGGGDPEVDDRDATGAERELRESEVGFGVPAEAYLATDRRSSYAAVVRYVDHFFGRLLATLRELGIEDETMVIFLSDHGESLGERGLIGHNRFFDEQLRVPLLVRMPGTVARRTDAPVQLIDVMPTVFAAVGVEPPFRFMGENLLPLLGGDGETIDDERIRISENKGNMAVVQGDWKVIFNPEKPEATRLYELSADPGELRDLAAERPALAERMIGHYYDLVAEHRSTVADFPHGDQPAELNDDVLKELRALGYIK